MTVAAGLFALSVMLRTLDRSLCGGFPLGTHFLWHLLNAVLLYLLLTGLIRYGRRRTANREPPAASRQQLGIRFCKRSTGRGRKCHRDTPRFSGKPKNRHAPAHGEKPRDCASIVVRSVTR